MGVVKLEITGTTSTRQDLWLSLFEYRNGAIYWRERGRGRNVELPAGFLTGQYLQIRFEKKAYAVHKIIYEMHHGDVETPIDHRDQDKMNNFVENLRPATKSQNEANTTKRVTNTSGYKGVYWSKQYSKWRAKIDHNKRQIHIGYFEILEDAAVAYNKRASELFGEFAFINKIPEGTNNA
jgi:hypothetical protein